MPDTQTLISQFVPPLYISMMFYWHLLTVDVDNQCEQFKVSQLLCEILVLGKFQLQSYINMTYTLHYAVVYCDFFLRCYLSAILYDNYM